MQTSGGGIQQFRINGSMFHRMNMEAQPFQPEDIPNRYPPQFLQLYYLDPTMANNRRHDIFSTLSQYVIHGLQECLHEHNANIRMFTRNAYDHRMGLDVEDVRLIFREDGTRDQRRWQAPTGEGADQIRVVMANVGDDGDADITHMRDIVVSYRYQEGERPRKWRISDLNPHYDALAFPLLFPYGETQWSTDMLHSAPLLLDIREQQQLVYVGPDRFNNNEPEGRGRGGTITLREHAAFRLMTRDYGSNHLLHAYRLSQEYMVDQYCRIEGQRLIFQKKQQKRIRADLFQGLQDAIEAADGDIDLANVGQRIILSSSFTGSPRHNMQLYMDSMAVVAQLGKQDLFLTFTCNPEWPEISEAILQEGVAMESADRPELISRVFNIKLKALIKRIIDDQVFGKVIAFLEVIEFQKRGLPHAHILIWFAPEDKPRTPEDIDSIVCAQLPDEVAHPELLQLVTKFMIHKCSPQKCCQEGFCSKRFPKQFREETEIADDGYPEYARPNNNRSVQVYIEGKGMCTFDNRHVVPYNPQLLREFGAHINVEVANNIVGVKYLHKYVYKGHDMGSAEFIVVVDPTAIRQPHEPGVEEPQRPVNELDRYVQGRTVAASEAAWRIYDFRLHFNEPAVIRLQLHTENNQMVTFQEDADAMLVADGPPPKTTLTEYFELNKIHAEARELFYYEIPRKFVWDNRIKTWTRRRRMPRFTPLGRVYSAFKTAKDNGERYYLRLLLHHVKGATSFESIRTIDGVIHATNKAACAALGLLRDDDESKNALAEASLWAMPRSLRLLFATLLAENQPNDPPALWHQFKKDLADDFLHQHRLRLNNMHAPLCMEVEDRALRHIRDLLQQHGFTLSQFNLREPNGDDPLLDLTNLPPIIQDHMRYDRDTLLASLNGTVTGLNIHQRRIYDAIMDDVEKLRSPDPIIRRATKCTFVYAAGGCGKTHVFNLLLDTVRSQVGGVALGSASSGIASQLLHGIPSTSHSLLKIPIQLDAQSVCNVPCGSRQAELLRYATTITIDEAIMLEVSLEYFRRFFTTQYPRR